MANGNIKDLWSDDYRYGYKQTARAETSDMSRNKQKQAETSRNEQTPGVGRNEQKQADTSRNEQKRAETSLLNSMHLSNTTKGPDCGGSVLPKLNEQAKNDGSNVVERIVSQVDAGQEMSNAQDRHFVQLSGKERRTDTHVLDLDEITQEPSDNEHTGFGLSEESDTEIGGSQIELAKIADAAEFKAVMPDDVLSHTDSDASNKVLCTKITGNDTLTENKEVIQSGEFPEPDEKNLLHRP